MTAVAGREIPPDVLFVGGRVFNVFTGEIESATVGTSAGRIAFVDATTEFVDKADTVIDVSGRLLIPGMVEPHGHGDLLYHPRTWSSVAASKGTTTAVIELLTLLVIHDDTTLDEVLEESRGWATKTLWSLRPTVDGFHGKEEAGLLKRAARVIDRWPEVVALGEIVGWRDLAEGRPAVCEVRDHAVGAGMRVDGHVPGGSDKTLSVLAAAGVQSDHEAITYNEVHRRLRLGYWCMVRGSSLRDDAIGIVRDMIDRSTPLDRVLLTTDGPTASDIIERGRTALGLVRDVIRGAGLDAVAAVRLATLNPAVYLGLDAHIGSIAPGRIADILICDDNLRLATVVLDGKPIVQRMEAQLPPSAVAPVTLPTLSPGEAISVDAIAGSVESAPRLILEGVLTRLAAEHEETPMRAALVDRGGEWIVAVQLGGDCAPFASTFTPMGHLLVVGTTPREMAALCRDVIALGGGIVCQALSLALEIGGLMTHQPMEAIAAQMSAMQRAWGSGRQPLEFVSLFLAMGAMPNIRLTSNGVVDVRSRAVLAPPTPVSTTAVFRS